MCTSEIKKLIYNMLCDDVRWGNKKELLGKDKYEVYWIILSKDVIEDL